MQTQICHDAETAAKKIIELAGPDLRVAAPVAIGKPNTLLNALYGLVAADKRLSMEIFTGLSLLKPRLGSGLEGRFAGPIIDAVFKDYPELTYARAMREASLPANIKVHEFFLQAGAWLNNEPMQQEFVSLGYASVAGHLRRLKLNVFTQLIAPDPAGGAMVSLSSNPDITLEMASYVDAARKAGGPIVVAGELNANLPYMLGEAEVPRDGFDILLDLPQPHFPLVSLPREAVPLGAYASALRVAALVKDGGTLQIGIGSFADAVTQALILRHTRNDDFRAMLAALGGGLPADAEQTPFDFGLYACSEMLVDGFMALMRAGILKRSVPVIDSQGQPIGGEAIIHAGFFLGHKDLYDALRTMPRADLERIRMTGIGFPNTLFGQEAAKREQRPHARFINSAMIATLLGAVSSDQLADGRVVSGVGGQHDFAIMGQELAGARSIIAIRAIRRVGGRTTSNVVWHYANTTLPRNLRDIIVSEYGIADVRGGNDRDTILAMIGIADQAFQPGLLQQAKLAGKMPRNCKLATGLPANTPQRIEAALRPFASRGLLPRFPFGTELNEVEQSLVDPLERLRAAGPWQLARFAAAGFAAGIPANATDEAALQRLELNSASGVKDRVLRALVLGAMQAPQN